MEELNNKISSIRESMKDMKAEMYAIVNSSLVSLDDYIKNLYIKMLCTVVQYENDPSDSQVLYLKRIIKGIGVEESLEEYMRKALGISQVDISEFISFMKENNVKYYFALEGILLISMENSKTECYEFLAEILELTGLQKQEFQYISLVAKSILMQDSAIYDDSKSMMPEKCAMLNFKPYISNYYAGVISDNKYLKSFHAPTKELSKNIELPASYTAKEVSFSNMIISIDDEWNFENCESVIFENCDITGGNYSIVFDKCKFVQFKKCTISNFTEYAILKRVVNELVFIDCEFSNCIYSYRRSTDYWKKLGGVIHMDEDKQIKDSLDNHLKIKIDRCIFTNCGGKNATNYYSSAVISNDRCEIRNSKFINCWHWHNHSSLDPDWGNRTLFAEGSTSGNNEVINSCKIV